MRLGRRTGYCSCVLLFRLRCSEGAMPNEHPKRPPKTGCWWTREHPGKDRRSFSKVGKGDWGPETGTRRNCGDVLG